MSQRLLFLFPAVVCVFAVHLVLQSFSQALWAGLVAAALLVLVLLAVTGSGRLILRAFGTRDLSESEKTLIGASLGLGILSQAVMVLGVLGLLRAWAISALLGILWVVGFTEMRDVLRSLGANRNLLKDRPLSAGGVLAALGVVFLMTWVPPHQYDALVYHLPLAAAYVREGRIYTIGHLIYTHFPQNAEMLYALALALGSDLLAQMFTWLGAFLSVWWLFEMGKREVPLSTVLLACLITATHTAVMLLGSIAYVECLVMLWITAAVFSFLRWREHANQEYYTRGWLALAGVFSGLALGTKYYAGICLLALGLYLFGRWVVAASRRAMDVDVVFSRGKDLAVYAGFAAALGSPWLIKNLLTIGNPVFPFFYRVLPARAVPWAAASAERYFRIMTEYGHSGHFLKDLVEFPYLAATGSTRFGGGVDELGSLGWGLLFVAVPVAVWAASRNRYLRWILAYCAVHWAVWFCTGAVLRFLVVLVPLASLVSAHGLASIWARLEPGGRGMLASGVALLIAINLGLFLYVHSLVRSLSVLVGLESRQVYLSRMLDYYPCAHFAAEKVPLDERILVVGEQRGYYVMQPHTTTTPLAPNPFVAEANAAADSRDLWRRLKEEGYGYIIMAPREAKRLSGYGIFDFSERGYGNWAGLEKGMVELVYESRGRCGVYKIQ